MNFLNVNTAVQILKHQETEKAICRELQNQIQKRETERKDRTSTRTVPSCTFLLRQNAVGIEGNVVYKVGVNDEWPYGNGLKVGEVVNYSRYCPGNDVDRLRKTMRNHDSLIPT
jgi:hypothetical protein